MRQERDRETERQRDRETERERERERERELALLVLPSSTVVKLRRTAEWREKSSSSASLSSGVIAVKDMTLTRMLIGTSCVCVACIPYLSSRADFVWEGPQNLPLVNTPTTDVCTLTRQFFYYVFGTKFRHTVRDIFFGRRNAKNRTKGDDQTGSQHRFRSLVN